MEQLKEILKGHGVELPTNPTHIQLDNAAELVEAEVESTLDEIEKERTLDPRYVIDTYLPMLSNQLEAMIQVQLLIHNLENQPEQSLNFVHDYGLWVGHSLGHDAAHVSPFAYMKAALEDGNVKITGHQTEDFLREFYTEELTDTYMAQLGFQK